MLDDAEFAPEIEADDNQVVLVCDYNPGGKKNLGKTDRIEVWLDKDHGFLPSKVKVYRISKLNSEYVWREITIDTFHEFSPGMWIPIKGHHYLYGLEPIFPEGITRENILGLEPAEAVAIGFKFRPVAMGRDDGFYPEKVVIDRNSLSVNQIIPDEIFQLKFPDGMEVLDRREASEVDFQRAATSDSVIIPGGLDDRPREWSVRFVVLLVNGAAILIFIVVLVVKKIRNKF